MRAFAHAETVSRAILPTLRVDWNCDVATLGGSAVPNPLGLLAELTHRCPLGCPYCSNPLAFDARQDELDTTTWARVFAEAAALGVLQVHLSGGEPGTRRDLVEITAAAHQAGLYTNLITSAVGLTTRTLSALAEAGLDHVQISIQDSEPESADHIAGYDGAFARKRALAGEVVRLRLPLTVNAVVHRANIDRIADLVDLALALGATALVIATGAKVDRLIPLYAIGVFTSFTLSQAGMAKHHITHKEPHWRKGLAINGTGAVMSAVVDVIIAITKFTHGAWAIVVLEMSDGAITGLHHFIYPELFAEFGLPPRLEREDAGQADELQQPA